MDVYMDKEFEYVMDEDEFSFSNSSDEMDDDNDSM